MNHYRSSFKLLSVLIFTLVLTLLVAAPAAAEADPYDDLPVHPFTLDATNDTCVDFEDVVVGFTRNCDPVNLIFPGRTWSEVVALLETAGWDTGYSGTTQALHYSDSVLYNEDEQLVQPATFGDRFHIRLWQAPGPNIVTFGAVHHEKLVLFPTFGHVIDMHWDDAEAAVASLLCGSQCGLTWYMPTQQAIQGYDNTWRSSDIGALRNDAFASVIADPNAPNSLPSAADDAYAAVQNMTLSVGSPGVLGNDADADGQSLTATMVANVTNGSLTVNPDGSFDYQPDPGFAGVDSFTYVAKDGLVDSNLATVTITVGQPDNNPPTAVDDSYGAIEDEPLVVNTSEGVLGNDSDPDGNPITAALVTGVSYGNLTLNADGSFTYAPDANFNGLDSFTYLADDGTAGSNPAMVTIAVDAVNDPPMALDDSYGASENQLLAIPAPGVLENDSDVDGDQLVAVLASGVSNGSLVLRADGSFDYQPDQGFFGADSFSYTASDGTANSTVATVNISVSQVNSLPIVLNDSYTTDENVPLSVPKPGVLENDSDPDGDPLTAALATTAANGDIAMNGDGSFLYTPNPDFSGQDAFTYVANDGTADSDIATVTITVNPVTEPPSVVDRTAIAEEAVAGTVAGTFSDTAADDANVQSITERDSGGRKDTRYSYLEHKWTFNVQAGDSVTFFVNAWQSVSTDGDNFTLAFSTDDTNYADMLTVNKTFDDDGYQTYALPAGTSGLVYVRVRDTDRTAGNLAQDTFNVDHMFIRTETASGTPPAAPTVLTATPVSAGQIDLQWSDNATDETGYELERSPDGASWSLIDSIGPDETTYSDVDLPADTLFHYRVRAFNASGHSAYAGPASATTFAAAGSIHIEALVGSAAITGPGGKWEATATVTVYDSSNLPVEGAAVFGDWSGGISGAGSCESPTDANGQCTIVQPKIGGKVLSVTFTVTGIVHPNLTYDPGSNQADPTVTIFRP